MEGAEWVIVVSGDEDVRWGRVVEGGGRGGECGEGGRRVGGG